MHEDLPSERGGIFPATAWSRILLGGGSGPGARAALEDVCQRYWQPARKFLRGLGCAEQDAEDLTQQFFAKWANAESLQRMDPAKGRLRSYLKQALRREMTDLWRARNTKGRGGVTLSLDSDEVPAEALATMEQADCAYDAAWAETVVAAVLGRLGDEYARRGRAALFALLTPALPGGGGELQPYAEIAVSAGMTEPQIKLQVHRLRKRFAERLREEVAETLADASELEDELRHLLHTMRHASGSHAE
jgi:RNA polymerase sigma factor (sigma-70 family)